MKKIKSNIKQILSRSLEEALDKLNALISPDSNLYDDFIILNGRFKELQRDELRNIVSDSDRDIKRNKLRLDFINITNDLREDDLIHLTDVSEEYAGNLMYIQDKQSFKKLDKKYLSIKKWINSNFNEFNFTLLINEPEDEGDGLTRLSEEMKQEVHRFRIFGSNLLVDYSTDHFTKMRNTWKEDNELLYYDFYRRFRDKYREVLNIEDIDRINVKATGEKDQFGNELFEILLQCEDDLKKISTSQIVELFRTKNIGEEKWEIFSEEGNQEDYKGHTLILKSQNEKFLLSVKKRLLELKNLSEKLS